MNYSKQLSIFLVLSMSNMHAYWGQSYLESFFNSLRTYWNQASLASMSPTQKKMAIAIGVLAGGLGIAYVSIHAKNALIKQKVKEAEGIAKALDRFDTHYDHPYSSGEIAIDATITMELRIEPGTSDLVMYLRKGDDVIKITDLPTMRAMTVVKAREEFNRKENSI